MKWIKLLFINKQMSKFQILNKIVTDKYDVELEIIAREKLIKLIKEL